MRLFRGFAYQEGDDSEITFIKSLALFVSASCCFCGIIWSIFYYQIFGTSYITLLPITFVAIVAPAAVVAHYLKEYRILIYAQIICIMSVTTLIQWFIGSIDQSGFVIAWGFLGPTGAMMFLDRNKAGIFMFVWFILLIISTFFEPNILDNHYDLPQKTKALFYFINVGASFTVLFLAFLFYQMEKERGLILLIKNRELERTNYEQELMLRQNEKLATLGRLSAGVAHELNNPAAAVQGGSIRLQKAMPELNLAQYKLGITDFGKNDKEEIIQFINKYSTTFSQYQNLDSLERSDMEEEMANVLSRIEISNPWIIAPELLNMGLTPETAEKEFKNFNPQQRDVLINVLYNQHITYDLLEEIKLGTIRITEIIKALKAYTYMDQSPRQWINLNEGLNNTLVMLRSKLKHGIIVHKDFENELLEINGFGSELNQVWTNLIDNAVDAMDGKGEIYLKTWSEGDNVYVEVKDNGKGIPKNIKANIFDPFFTTKEQGKGTGLGLHISYNIVVNKHHGEISVASKPGETIFLVKLPVSMDLKDPSDQKESLPNRSTNE